MFYAKLVGMRKIKYYLEEGVKTQWLRLRTLLNDMAQSKP